MASGESADDRHRDEIEVLALNWGVSNPGTMAHGGGAGAGKATFSDFQISKRVDRASPTLLKMCATQARIEEGMLAVRKAGRGAQDYMIITMKEVIITSVSLAGTQGDSADLTEAVTLQFAKVGSNTSRRSRMARSTPQSRSSTTSGRTGRDKR